MSLTAQTAAPVDFSAARRAMIDSQLRVSGVNQEPVLAAMRMVPREDFVPGAARSYAYIDRAIRLDDHHALPAPLVQGLMLAEADLRFTDQVLVVSCGSGYLSALASRLAGTVTTILAAQAAHDQWQGTTDGCTVLLIDGAIEHLPDGLVARLADNARVVTGLVERGVTRLARGRKIAGSVALLAIGDLGMPVLPEFNASKSWSF